MMPMICRTRKTILAFAAMLSVVLVAPAAVRAQEESFSAAPALPSWDETSGYASLETSRAINALPAAPTAVTSLVPADVRWAPEQAIAPMSPAKANRAIAAQRALLSVDLGSMQEEALTIVVEVSVAASPASLPEYLAAALASGERGESAHLATVPLSAQDASVTPNSDDRIANAPFGAV